MRTLFLTLAILFVHCLANANAQELSGVGPVQKVFEGFQFTEGPAFDGHKYLYFTDIPNNRIHRGVPGGELETFLEESKSCNGLMFDGAGQLIGCQMQGNVVAIDPSTKEIRLLTSEYRKTRYNACNDLVIDRKGGIYFTDPRYAAPEPWPQGKEAFYYRAPDGNVVRLGESLRAPNGILLSPDESVLYVVPSMQKQVMAYRILAPGKIDSGKVLCELKQPEGKEDTGGDGLTIDVEGNLYITSDLGVQCFTPEGKLLGIIAFPEQPANCAFGGPDNKTLFATCRTSVYSVAMPRAGFVFQGIVP